MASARNASLKAALLGLSHPHSEPHLATLQNLPEVAEIVVWDEKLDRRRHRPLLQSASKISFCTDDLGSVLGRGDVDFAILCVPTDVAAGIACRVVAAGIHLMAEKPGGLNPAEIRKVIRTAARSGAATGVLYANRSNPAIAEARRLVRSGAIGEILSMEVRMITTQVRFRDPRSWLFQRRRAGGGVLTWLGCHLFDLLRHVSGDEIVSVCAQLATRSGEKIDVEDVAALALRFRSGAVGTFHADYALAFAGAGYLNAGGNDIYVAWTGRGGRVVWPDRLRLHIESQVERGSPIREKLYKVRHSSSYGGSAGEAFLRQFIAAFRDGAEPGPTLEDALRTAEIIQAAHRSAQAGREVTI